MTSIIPPPLTPGDTVAVVAPAGSVDPARLQFGCDLLGARYALHMDDRIAASHRYLAGDDHRRLCELQDALDRDDTRAVIAARGGYGTSRLLSTLGLDRLATSPKWVVGSSDLTALLVHLFAARRLVTIHGPMVATLHRAEQSDIDRLFGLLESAPGDAAVRLCLTPHLRGEATGPFIGGNLTLLAHLMGTIDIECFDGAILFIEDVDEQPYRLDRCLTQLDRAGLLPRLAGVVIGDLTRCGQWDDALAAVLGCLDKYRIPVASGYPAAHGGRNRPFRHGGRATLTVDQRAWLSGDI